MHFKLGHVLLASSVVLPVLSINVAGQDSDFEARDLAAVESNVLEARAPRVPWTPSGPGLPPPRPILPASRPWSPVKSPISPLTAAFQRIRQNFGLVQGRLARNDPALARQRENIRLQNQRLSNLRKQGAKTNDPRYRAAERRRAQSMKVAANRRQDLRAAAAARVARGQYNKIKNRVQNAVFGRGGANRRPAGARVKRDLDEVELLVARELLAESLDELD